MGEAALTQRRITFEGDGTAVLQRDDDTVLRAALRAGVGFPYECSSGGCGSCKFELIEGELENLWSSAPGLSERDRRKKRFLACQCRPKSDLRIKVRVGTEYMPPIRPKRHKAKVIGTSDVTHDIREFRLLTKDKAEFLPGQYALLAIPGVGAMRAYSMSNIANAEGEWHFQVRLVPGGAATERLFHHLRAGDEVEVDGPYGLAWLREDSPRDIVCVAGGSGLAPMVSLARGASAAGMLKSRQLHFFYGGRMPRDICGESFLRQLPEFGTRIHFYPVVSMHAQAAEATWHGATGLIHEEVRRQLGERLVDCEIYFAGPPPMTQALQEMLMVNFRVPFEQIHFDRFF